MADEDANPTKKARVSFNVEPQAVETIDSVAVYKLLEKLLHGQKKLEEGQNKLEEGQKDLKKRMMKMEWDKSFQTLNPWLNMAQTTRSSNSNALKKIIEQLKLEKRCWLTGIMNEIKLAHILPDSCPDVVFTRLRLPIDFKNNLPQIGSIGQHVYNFLILNPKVEFAFDQLKLSFVVKDILHPSQFILKIWDRSCAEVPLDGHDSACIGDYEGRVLNLPLGYMPSRRALSYQTLCAYMLHKSKGTVSTLELEPADFASDSSSLIEGDSLRKQLIDEFNRSCLEEEAMSLDVTDDVNMNGENLSSNIDD
jgi:hypothetical protein